MKIMIVQITQNGVVNRTNLNIKKEPENEFLDCTAYEYGIALAEAIKDSMNIQSDAKIDVMEENGTVIHRLVFTDFHGEYAFTDHAPGSFRPLVKFKLRTEKIPEHYLILVDPERNKNEFYKMNDMGGGEWGATYGRIGERQGRSRVTRNVVVPKSYPDYMFELKRQEKLQKGYQDKSECHSVRALKKKEEDATLEGISNEQVANLLQRLMNFAKMAIKRNYTISYTDVTESMIHQASEALNRLRESKSVDEFNGHLLSLMHIIPRKIDRKNGGVKQYLASSAEDYAEIVVRETDLLDIMESQIHFEEKSQSDSKKNLLEKMELEVYEATPEETEEAREQLTPSLKPKLKRVFRVVNRRTQTQFEQFLESSHSPNVKLFWHGSRNANWFSILQKGLLLNPNAQITGKMFGNGIYFAPSAMKSWGYTSSWDARWTDEDSSSVFMALYATAYGNPYEVYSHDGSWGGYNNQRLEKEHPGWNCVHAKADKGMLYNDEVIFYREDQMTIKYLCEFAAN